MCRAQRIDEWLRVICPAGKRKRTPKPSGIDIIQGGRGEAMVTVTADAISMVVPIFSEEPMLARFFWTDRARDLRVTWPDARPNDRPVARPDDRPVARPDDNRRAHLAFSAPIAGAGKPFEVTEPQPNPICVPDMNAL